MAGPPFAVLCFRIRVCMGAVSADLSADPEQVMYWVKPKAKGKVVTPNGEVISCEFSGESDKATGLGFVSHWSTCPEAGRFRRKQ